MFHFDLGVSTGHERRSKKHKSCVVEAVRDEKRRHSISTVIGHLQLNTPDDKRILRPSRQNTVIKEADFNVSHNTSKDSVDSRLETKNIKHRLELSQQVSESKENASANVQNLFTPKDITASKLLVKQNIISHGEQAQPGSFSILTLPRNTPHKQDTIPEDQEVSVVTSSRATNLKRNRNIFLIVVDLFQIGKCSV